MPQRTEESRVHVWILNISYDKNEFQKEEGVPDKSETPSTNLLPTKDLPIYEVLYHLLICMQIEF